MEGVSSRAVVRQEKERQKAAERERQMQQQGFARSRAVTKETSGSAISANQAPKVQRNSARPTQKEPNAPETSRRYWLSQIARETERDATRGQELYGLYEDAVKDPSSPLYSVYAQPTSTNPKYNAQTEKALAEWQNLQGELSYWARNDRNYSDDEIIGRIDWGNYPTLAKMNATRDGGQTVYLTQPVGYSEDAMYGVLWAARNPEMATDDMTVNAGFAAGGYGTQPQRDEQKAARLDPASKDYNPYLVGSTMDSQLQTYGVNGFGADWLDNNLQYRGTDDYTKIYRAEQTTKAAEDELEALQASLDAGLSAGLTADEVFTADLLDDYSTLRGLQESLDKGVPVDTTRAIGYDMPGMRRAYEQAFQKVYGTVSDEDYAAGIASATGAKSTPNQKQQQVNAAADQQRRKGTQVVAQSGTYAEKKAAAASGASYGSTREQIQADIQTGTAGAQGALASKRQTVAQKTAPSYFQAMDAKTVQPSYSDELNRILEKAGVETGSEDYTNRVAQSLAGQAASGDLDAAQLLDAWNNGGVQEYWEHADADETNQAADTELAAIDAQWKDAYGDNTPEYRAHKNTMEAIYSFRAAPKQDWGAYDIVAAAQMQEGATQASVKAYAGQAAELNRQSLAQIDDLMEQAAQMGAPDVYLQNMQQTRDMLEKQGRLIDSHSLKENGDYTSEVAAFDQEPIGTDYNQMNNEDDLVVAAIKSPDSAAQYARSPLSGSGNSLTRTHPDLFYALEMTDDERSNFKYLYEAQGRDSALAYYEDLRDNLAARYAVGESEAAAQLGQTLPVTATLTSILMSPLQVEGAAYTLLQALKSEQADPNSMAFSANRMTGGNRAGVKEAFGKLAGDNEAAKNIFAFFYDALTSTGDSLMTSGLGGMTGMANAGLALMSAEASSHAMQEALLKGADSKTAALAGLASGAAEALTEKIPFDNITEAYHAGNAGGKILKLIADNVIGEGTGEGLSEYLGAIGDYLVMGNDSEFVENVNQYQENGMSEDEAIRQVVNDLTAQALYAAMAGTVSGMASTAISYGFGRMAGGSENADAAETQQEAPEAAQSSQVQENQPEPGKALETSEKGAANANESDVTGQNVVNVLYAAQQNGVGQVLQTASVDAALRALGVEDATATATARELTANGDLAKVTRLMEAAPDKGKAAQAITMAMLNPDSESAATLTGLDTAAITADDATALCQMYDLDMQDADARSTLENAVEESQLATDTVTSLGQADAAQTDAAQEGVKQAKRAAREAEANLQAETDKAAAAQSALDAARERRMANLNPDTIAAESKALDAWGKAVEKQQAAARQFENARQDLAEANSKQRQAQEASLNQAREVALEQQRERMEIKKIDYAVQQQNVDANIQQVAQMGSVVTLDGDEFSAGGTDLRQQVAAYFDSFGGVASNPMIGDVALTRRGAKNSISHGIGNEKAVAFAAVPSVIENGQIIDVQQNWKGRGYDTLVIAAPITIEGGPSAGEYYCGVVVKRAADTQQYYVHEVLLKNNEGANVAVQPVVRPNESSVASGGAKAPSVNSLLQRVIDVKQGNVSENADSAISAQNSQNTFSATGVQENGQAGGNGAGTSQNGVQRENEAPRMGQSQFATKTGQNTSVLTEETKQRLRENPLYQKQSQQKSVERAISNVEREGYEARKNRLLLGTTDILTPDGQTEAYVLSQIAKENGDAEGQAAIAFRVKESGTLLAQSLAMRKLYTEMTPEAKVSYVQKLVDQINDQYENQGKDTRVTLPGWVEQAIEAAGDDQKQLSDVLDRAYREIAQQMPYSVKDTLRTWRFLSMLGNPMTHIKNMLANAAFMPYVAAKNRIAAVLETGVTAAQEALGKETMKRSKTLGPLKAEYKAYAAEVCSQVEDILSGNEKANANNGKSKIEEYRQKAPALIDWLSRKNGDLLGGEDLMAKNHYFKYALASYLQANNADLSNVSDTLLANATQYAVNEAYKNTFNNVNEFASWLSKTEKSLASSANPVARGAGVLLEGTVPFKNTPANIVSRGVEYSPVGLFNAIFLNYGKLKKGVDYQGNAFTMQNYLDGIATGLTGTAAVALGGLLASAGILDLGGDDDDEMRGKNQNSVNIAGYNIGIDWSGVAAMPLLMGAQLWNRWTDKGEEPLSFNDYLNGFKSIADPVMDLSMVQGITALLDTASYSDNALGTMATKMATSYLGQFVPTVFGAVTRTFFDDTRRTTYTDKNSDLSSETQYLLQSMGNKIPGLSKEGMAYLNAWGEEQKTDSLLERFLTNFLLPGYAKKIKTDDEVTEALLEMYDKYGDSGYLPTRAKKSFNVGGEKYNLTQTEYTQYAKERGSIAHELLGALMKDAAFRAAEPEFQLDAITDVWTYASQTAAYNVNEGFKRTSWVASAGDPKETILEKMKERVVAADRNKFKESFFDAYETGDIRSMRMCVAGLESYGYQKSSLRQAVKTRYQAQYRQMYDAGDLEGMRELREAMLAAGIGFKATDFDKWLEEEKK